MLAVGILQLIDLASLSSTMSSSISLEETRAEEVMGQLFVTRLCTVIVLSLVTLTLFYLALKLYQEYGWTVYKTFGAGRQFYQALKAYHIYRVIFRLVLYFSCQFEVIFVFLLSASSHKTIDNKERIQVTLAFVCVLAMLVLGYVAMKRENRVIMAVYVVLLMSFAGYLIYRLVLFYTEEREMFFIRHIRFVFSSFLHLSVFLCLLSVWNALVRLSFFGCGYQEDLVTKARINALQQKQRHESKQLRVMELDVDDDDDDGISNTVVDSGDDVIQVSLAQYEGEQERNIIEIS